MGSRYLLLSSGERSWDVLDVFLLSDCCLADLPTLASHDVRDTVRKLNPASP